ncbi:Phospholipase A(1) DAD1 [Diplonema papillatum]|nr:Phospholipase A(1) DAD1 [Diplonema papillatum]
MRLRAKGNPQTDSYKSLLTHMRRLFESDPIGQESLLATGNKTLVNMSDRDPYWGVGHDGDGRALFCKMLMELREEYHDLSDEDDGGGKLKVQRVFDWLWKDFRIVAVISSAGLNAEDDTGAEESEFGNADRTNACEDKEVGEEAKCIILATHDGEYPPYVIVSFRGTVTFQEGDTDFRNIYTDCNCSRAALDIPGLEGTVHHGFLSLWRKVKHKVFNALIDRLELPDENDETTLVFTGHSLGGALATLAAAEAKARYFKKRPVTMYNYGSPRVGDSEFSESYDRMVPDSFRVVCKGDPITMMPPMACFTHVGHSVLINSSGEFVVDAGYIERRSLPYFNPIQHFRFLDSHRRGDAPGSEPGYLRCISNLAMKFNLRTQQELAQKMHVGQKYSPEWRRLWSVCSLSLDPLDCDRVFLAEAISFCGEPPPVAVQVPLRVYYSDLKKDFLVAATAEQQDWAVAHGFQYTETLGEVFTFPRGDGRSWFEGECVPLYSYFNQKRSDHLLCSSNKLRKFAKQNGYRKVSIEGYVFPGEFKPRKQYLRTIGLEVYWNSQELNHKVTKTGSTVDSLEKVDVGPGSGADCYILERPVSARASKLWNATGALPMGLLVGLLFVAAGKSTVAPAAATLTAIGVLTLGFLLSRIAAVTRFPRLIDVICCVAFGVIWTFYGLGNWTVNVKKVWSVPLLLACYLCAALLTLFLNQNFVEDLWMEDRSIPRGTATHPAFLFFLKVHAHVHLGEITFLGIASSIPGMMDFRGSYANGMDWIALSVVVAIFICILYQHAVVFMLMFYSCSHHPGPLEVYFSTIAWNVEAFCELFPAPPSIIVGRFVIREVRLPGDESARLVYEVGYDKTGSAPSPENLEAYESELATLLKYPATKTHVTTTAAEGPDGTWGQEIRFNLVTSTYETAHLLLKEVADKLSEFEAPSNLFPHTMRVVAVIPGWAVKVEAHDKMHNGLLDLRFRRAGSYPPIMQLGRSLAFARNMASCLRNRYVDASFRSSKEEPTASPAASPALVRRQGRLRSFADSRTTFGSIRGSFLRQRYRESAKNKPAVDYPTAPYG